MAKESLVRIIELRNAREAAGYTRREVVAALQKRGVRLSERTLARWETGRARVPAGAMLAMAVLYDREPLEFAY